MRFPWTGKRQARPNPQSEWITQDVPALRIIDDELWQNVKERQKHIRHALTHDGAGIRSERARRPVYLLSHLLKCGTCGGGFSKVSANHYGCSNARNRGTCDNLLTIRRDILEASVLAGLRTHLMEPDLVKEFVAEYHRELNRRNAGRDQARAAGVDELARIERQIRSIVEAIRDGMRTPSMKEELLALEDRKERLTATIDQAPAAAPRLHPGIAEIYREKVARLEDELNRPELRTDAAEAIRSLIDEIKLTPEEGRKRQPATTPIKC